MIDPIGTKPGTIADRRTGIVSPPATGGATADVRVAKVGDVAPLSTRPETLEIGARAAAQEMAATPPVDHERVAEIRAAIAKGKFPIVPALIADRIIAVKEGWRG